VKRPALINVALFALSQRWGYCLILAGVLLLVWWNLADFYVCKRFPDRPELNETLPIGGVFMLMVLILVWATRRKLRRGLRRFAQLDQSAKGPETPDEWRTMLSEIADHCDGFSGGYVNWLKDLGSRWKPWISASWLPALAIFLAFPPLHSGLMEYLSNFSRKTPPSLLDRESEAKAGDFIFAIDSMAEHGKEAPVVTGLVFRDGKWDRPEDSKVGTASKTYLIFHAGDYPHVHRRVEVLECGLPNCSVPPAESNRPDPLQPRTCFSALRRARACFEYWQPHAAYLPLRLNVRAVLRTLWGYPLDSARIN